MNNIINTRFWKKQSLSQYVHNEDGSLTLFALFTLGVISAVIHQHLKMGLNLPGHHGLEWMTVLLFGRMQSRHRWAALMIASGAASSYMTQTAFFPLAHAFTPALVYLINGICLDVLYTVTPRKFPVYLKGPVLGGISFVMKPVLLVPIVMTLDLSVGSFDKHGYIFPIYTHFAFGTIGGICGILLAEMARNGKSKKTGTGP